MYVKNVSIEEIIKTTKLDYSSIEQTIQKRQTINSNKYSDKNKKVDDAFISINKNDYRELQNDVKIMKNEIKDLKNNIKELIEMMKAVYEFEDT